MSKFKSKLEENFARKFSLPYETDVLPYVITHKYHPDWKLGEKIYLETKGRWTGADRSKIRLVMEQNDAEVVMVFQNETLKLSKSSKTSYADYCDKHGIRWFRYDDPKLAEFIAQHK